MILNENKYCANIKLRDIFSIENWSILWCLFKKKKSDAVPFSFNNDFRNSDYLRVTLISFASSAISTLSSRSNQPRAR